MTHKVIVWNNDGERSEHDCASQREAWFMAKAFRTLSNRTVKIAHCGDAIRHWSRTATAKRNHWATHSTAERSR